MTATTPQQKISKYFQNGESDDDDSKSLTRAEVVEKAMKKEWWYDMFDVNKSQFDVSSIVMKEFISGV